MEGPSEVEIAAHQRAEQIIAVDAADEAAGNVVFLHADQDSITKKVLEKLGFREVGRRYEYFSAEIGSLTAKRRPSG